jgi:hypothetical protein
MTVVYIAIALVVILGIVWFIKKPSLVSTASPSSPALDTHPYKAVRVKPHQHACDAAFERSHRVYLVAEAPFLPLSDCTKSDSCRCGYMHYDDRRQPPERRGGSVVIEHGKEGKERRDQENQGRRKTDIA